MPFRARVNPASLARRAARARLVPTPFSAPPTAPPARGGQATPGPGPSTLQARAFHSTAPPRGLGSFLSFSKAPASPADAVMAAAASGSRDLPLAWKKYADSSSSRVLGADEVLVLLHAIENLHSPDARHSPPPGPLAAVAVQSYESLADPERSGEHHAAAVRILAALPFKFGRRMAVDIATAHPGAMGRAEWDALIAATDGGELFERVVPHLPPDDHTFFALAELRRRAGVTRRELDELLALMGVRGVQAGPWAEVSLAQMYTAVGDHRAAETILARWPNADADHEGAESAEREEELADARWRARLWIGVQRADAATVRALLAHSRGEPPVDALSFLVFESLPPSASADDVVGAITAVSDEVGFVLPPAAWDAILQTLVSRSPATAEALKPVWDVYASARQLGPPSPALAMALIERLTSLEPPLFDEAVEVYTDLTTHGDDLPPLRVQVYVDLLKAVQAVPPTPEVKEAVLSHLLVDMATGPHRLDRMFAASLVGALWERFADDHPSAYDMYDAVLSVSHPLDASQWESMLLRFIALSFPNSAVPTPDILVRMLADMRAAGHAPGPRILSGLLTSYADMAKAVSRHDDARAVAAVHSELLAASRNVQSLLSLDSGLVVDVRLLTALMDALQSVGAFDDALGVWAEIVRRSPTFAGEDMGAAVGVMLDACGHAGQTGRGVKIWAWARKRGFVVSERDWAPYVEMLARGGRLDDAIDTLAEMERESETGGPKPTLDVGLIPLKFARGTPGKVQHVRERLVKAFPHWEERLFRATDNKA